MPAAGMEPNAENKLFVGGCPASSGEDDLREVRAPAPPSPDARRSGRSVVLALCFAHTRPTALTTPSPSLAQLFEKHGTVEEVFVMRGGSRSGMACAFVRFASQPMAQAAIDAIHGRITLPDAAEPLVVRWADAPGSRKRENNKGQRGGRNGGGGSGANNLGGMGGIDGWGAPPMMMANGIFGYPPMMMMGQPPGPMLSQGALLQQQAAMNGTYGGGPYGYGGGAPSYANGGMLPQHMGHPGFPQQQQMIYVEQIPQQMMGGQHPFYMQGPPSPTQAPPQMGPMGGPMGGPPMMAPLSPQRVDAGGGPGPPQGGGPPNGYPPNSYAGGGGGGMPAAPMPIAAGPGPQGMM